MRHEGKSIGTVLFPVFIGVGQFDMFGDHDPVGLAIILDLHVLDMAARPEIPVVEVQIVALQTRAAATGDGATHGIGSAAGEHGMGGQRGRRVTAFPDIDDLVDDKGRLGRGRLHRHRHQPVSGPVERQGKAVIGLFQNIQTPALEGGRRIEPVVLTIEPGPDDDVVKGTW